MREHDMSQQIKEIRKHYGLSQQAFARLLGIGEASITRYEKGIAPTKANANLIRATMIPAFMAGCLERDGDALTPKQRASVEKIVYAEVTFDEGGDVMDTTEIYEITLQQEVLNESAWDIMAQIFHIGYLDGTTRYGNWYDPFICSFVCRWWYGLHGFVTRYFRGVDQYGIRYLDRCIGGYFL